MFTKLRLQDFKNFRDATLHLAPLTVLVGANASGKSNVFDACYFLHGISRGYTLPELFGGKYGPAGEPVWNGLRGGTSEAAFEKGGRFRLEVAYIEELINLAPKDAPQGTQQPQNVEYLIELQIPGSSRAASIAEETVRVNGQRFSALKNPSHWETASLREGSDDIEQAKPRLPVWADGGGFETEEAAFPALSVLRSGITGICIEFRAWRFFDWDLSLLRAPVVAGHKNLGPRGENFASVLHGMTDGQKGEILSWIRTLTPVEFVGFDFPKYSADRFQLALVEPGGRVVSADSVSDGTLRFLAYLTALMSARPGQTFFFEEPENGIHPLRLKVLIRFFEQMIKERGIQIILTTHSPALLDCLSEESRNGISLIYREEGADSSDIVRLMDLPHAREVIAERGFYPLHFSSWMEDTTFFSRHPGED